jgi:hypothetical protein
MPVTLVKSSDTAFDLMALAITTARVLGRQWEAREGDSSNTVRLYRVSVGDYAEIEATPDEWLNVTFVNGDNCSDGMPVWIEPGTTLADASATLADTVLNESFLCR